MKKLLTILLLTTSGCYSNTLMYSPDGKKPFKPVGKCSSSMESPGSYYITPAQDYGNSVVDNGVKG